MKKYICSGLFLMAFAFLLSFGAWQFLKNGEEMPTSTAFVNINTGSFINSSVSTSVKALKKANHVSQYTDKEQKSGELETLMKQIADLTR